ncbi:MAG: glycerophosphodiester phosphodiesterase [Promethearchaeota archaeon]
MIYISHRGFRVGVIENTFQAFQCSIDLNMDFIELDVQLSCDGQLFVLHDENLKRIFQNPNSIANLSRKELNSIRSRESNQKIPELKKVIERIPSHETKSPKLMIELKGPGTAEPICKLIEGSEIKDRIVFSGRNLTELKIAHKLQPQIPICLNITKCKDFTLQNLMKIQSINTLPLPFSLIFLKSNLIINDKFPGKCHQLGIKAISWGFYDKANPTSLIKFLITSGIDGILFDDPENVPIIRKWLKIKNSMQ